MHTGSMTEFQRRGVVAVAGPDAATFLNDLVTADIDRATPGQAVYAGLLTPQGKILFDFIIFVDGERFLFDIARASVADFVKRLGFYRLRAKVTVDDVSTDYRVIALWGPEGVPHVDGISSPDPRLASLGVRVIVPASLPQHGFTPVGEAEYDAHRISLGIPEGGIDFAFGDTFPHDVDMEQLSGVDFGKGCYIGQEVVSRMEHRGTARRRFILAQSKGRFPPVGTAVNAAGKAIGTLGSSSNGSGLAMVRLDRAKDAIDAGTPIMAGDSELTLSLPGWATFRWPETVSED
jgi:tRNA-modifying protein YgfZ